MGDYISGSVYFSGIGNGTDFSSIIEQLQKIEEIPKNRLELWKADWQLRYNAFDEVCKTMSSAQTTLMGINSPSKFVTKVATSSETSIMSAKANADAVDSTHTIQVKQLASNAIWAYNGQFDSKTSVINSTGAVQKFSYTYKGKTREISIANGTTLESFMNIVNNDSQNLGVRMSLIQSGGKYSFQIQGKDSGAASTLTINSSGLRGLGTGNQWAANFAATDATQPLGAVGEKINVSFTSAGVTTTLSDLDASSTSLEDLRDAINTRTGAQTAALAQNGDGTWKLTLNNVDRASVTSGKDPETLHTLDGSSEVTMALWTGSGAFDSASDPIGNAGDKFSFTLNDGTIKSFTLNGGESLNDIAELINDPVEGVPGTASVETTGDGKFRLVLNDVTSASMVDAGDNPVAAFAGQAQSHSRWTSDNAIDPEDSLTPDDRGAVFTYVTLNAQGQEKTNKITLEKGQTIDDLVTAINAKTRNTASINGEGKLVLDGVVRTEFSSASTRDNPLATGAVSNVNWSIQKPQDAVFKVDNWPRDLTSSSNTITDAIPGLTINLYDTGTAKVSVSTDSSSVKENIQTFLDAINSVLLKISELTKVDEDKKTYDSKSQFTNEKGSVLTGNYGVQLLKSRLQTTVTSTPPGFNKIQGTDLLSGDLVASLAEMGIKVCTEQGNPNYGLFMIAPPGSSQDMQLKDQERFDQALEKSLDAVIQLFSCDGQGASSSPDFRYASHVKGTTKGGSYDVNYDVDEFGNIGKVYINGKEAHLDTTMGPTWYTAGSEAGDAAGMAIVIDDLTPGRHSGKVSIKQGLAGRMEDFLKGELKDDKYSNNSGAMVILKKNYQDIMDNIDKKIEKEEVRILKWVQTQRLAFARLDTLLGQYNGKQKQVESQIKQLTAGSS